PAKAPRNGLTAAHVFSALSEVRPAHALMVVESPSTMGDLHKFWPITEPATYFTSASGGLGWSLPASVGIALGERETGSNRPVIMVIGDGSFQYSLQAIWTAANLQLPILVVVLRNEHYDILKSGFQVSIFPSWTSSLWQGAMAAMPRASTIWRPSRWPQWRLGPKQSQPCWKFLSRPRSRLSPHKPMLSVQSR